MYLPDVKAQNALVYSKIVQCCSRAGLCNDAINCLVQGTKRQFAAENILFFPPESPHVISLTKDSEFMIPFHSVRDFVENSLKLQTRMYVELVSLRSEVEQLKRNGISHPVMDNLDCIAGDKLQPKDSYSAPQSNDVKACHEISIPRYPSFPAEWEKLGEKNIADAFKAYYKYQMHRAEKKSKKASKAFSDIKTVVE